MKNLTKAICVSLITIAFSCGKKSTEKPAAPAGNTITISGKAYATVTIGNQIWTASNYTGPATNILYSNAADSATTGNYYNNMSGVNLPAGWRLPGVEDYNKLMGNYSSNADVNGNNICNLDITQGLIAKTSWTGFSGTNTSGFNAYAVGYINYFLLLRKSYPQADGTGACFLTSNSITYADYATGALSPGLEVFKISSTGSTYNFYTYYASISSLSDDEDNIQGYCSLRFVRDK